MSQSKGLQDIYAHAAVRDFGRALRIALRQQKDFSSLVDLDGAERPEDFAEALKRFLRRFDALARRRRLRRPTQQMLEEIAELVDSYGVKVVRAAIISHALVAVGRPETEEEVSEEVMEEEGNGHAN
ncbi:MAG: hypothetical protein J7450_12660 [Thermomicrobium sp.]|jgi:hypothetical protein|uniref:hypothetical protein n=1 Tax=Thermomicrobium sp. TaxID=1969469 RepID=UPI001B285771|nr:hypothetical protein [Thermomicrobium sp.]MBO9360396.1 hypothetical protein [Thermomicrobium sp.]